MSTLSGATPEIRKSPHLFIELEQLHGFLEEWTQSGEHLQPEIANYLKGHFLGEPLRDWDISRPGAVLRLRDSRQPGQLLVRLVRRADRLHGLDAAVVRPHGREVRRLVAVARLRNPPLHRQGHHVLPHAVLARHAQDGRLQPADEGPHPRLPHRRRREDVEEQGHVRRRARRTSNHLDPSYLRYFYASKLSSRVEDLDLAVDEFVAKVNTDLVNKVVNLASRTAKFVESDWPVGQVSGRRRPVRRGGRGGRRNSRGLRSDCDYSRAMRLIMGLADRANPYVEDRKPWELRKDPARAARAAGCLHRRRSTCSASLSCILSPVLPRLAEQTGELLERSDRALGRNRKRRSSARRSPSSSTCSSAWKKRTCKP